MGREVKVTWQELLEDIVVWLVGVFSRLRLRLPDFVLTVPTDTIAIMLLRIYHLSLGIFM
jgi:hypothetical protein